MKPSIRIRKAIIQINLRPDVMSVSIASIRDKSGAL
jgi:hypothetical protein